MLRLAFFVAAMAAAQFASAQGTSSLSTFIGGWQLESFVGTTVTYQICVKENRVDYTWTVDLILGTTTYQAGGTIVNTNCQGSVCAVEFSCDVITDGVNLCVGGRACAVFNKESDGTIAASVGPQVPTVCSLQSSFPTSSLLEVTPDGSACSGDFPVIFIVLIGVGVAFVLIIIAVCFFCRGPSTAGRTGGPTLVRAGLAGGGVTVPAPAPSQVVTNPLPSHPPAAATIAIAPVISPPHGHAPPPPPPASMATVGYPGSPGFSQPPASSSSSSFQPVKQPPAPETAAAHQYHHHAHHQPQPSYGYPGAAPPGSAYMAHPTPQYATAPPGAFQPSSGPGYHHSPPPPPSSSSGYPGSAVAPPPAPPSSSSSGYPGDSMAL